MIKLVITNIITSIVIHAALCCVSYFIINSLARFQGSVFANIFFIGIAIAIPLLYILCGRLFIHNTGTIFYNILSIAVLAIILLIVMSMPSNIVILSNYSILPITVSMQMIFPEFITFPLAAILPSLLLYVGIIIRK